jgi:hypothetical protein
LLGELSHNGQSFRASGRLGFFDMLVHFVTDEPAQISPVCRSCGAES